MFWRFVTYFYLEIEIDYLFWCVRMLLINHWDELNDSQDLSIFFSGKHFTKLYT